MRKFKFRAWDKVKKVMIEHDDQHEFYICNEYGNITFPIKTPNEYRIPFGEGEERFELMQFTGLHDRNGKEIYEGDIVKYTSKERTGTKVSYKRRGYDTYAITSDIEIIGFIKFDVNENLMTFIVDTKQVTKYDSYFWGEGKRTDRPNIAINSLVKPLSTKREYEVIGNIYENPELVIK